jgi:hypothetical protein
MKISRSLIMIATLCITSFAMAAENFSDLSGQTFTTAFANGATAESEPISNSINLNNTTATFRIESSNPAHNGFELSNYQVNFELQKEGSRGARIPITENKQSLTNSYKATLQVIGYRPPDGFGDVKALQVAPTSFYT